MQVLARLSCAFAIHPVVAISEEHRLVPTHTPDHIHFLDRMFDCAFRIALDASHPFFGCDDRWVCAGSAPVTCFKTI